jgi:hypothetical protein
MRAILCAEMKVLRSADDSKFGPSESQAGSGRAGKLGRAKQHLHNVIVLLQKDYSTELIPLRGAAHG